MSGYLAGRVWLSSLESNLKPIAACLANFANDEGDGVFPSNGYLQWLLGWGESTVRNAMAVLRRNGFLIPIQHEQGGRGKIPVYRIDVESLPSRPSWKEFKRGQNSAPLPERGQNTALKGPESSSRNKEDLKDKINLKLCPPSSDEFPTKEQNTKKQNNSDPRYQEFVDAIANGYERRGWKFGFSGPDGKQLKNLLAYRKSMSVSEFRICLKHYFDSEGVVPGAMPRTYLMKLPNYWAGPLNQYGKLVENKVHNDAPMEV